MISRRTSYVDRTTCAGTSFASKCSDGVSCTTDKCDGKGGCLGNTLKSDWCLINNTCYKANAANPSGQCEACVPAKSQAGWTPVSNTCTISNKCYVKGAKHTAGCAECDPAMSLSSWVVKGSTHCLVSDKCVASGAKDTLGCASCQPLVDRYAYSPLPGMCKIDGKCYQTGDKHPLGCAQCDASVATDKWTVKVSTHCLINNKCVTAGTKDPTPGACSSCQPAVNRYDCSADSGYCKIQGVCIKNGAAHPKGCATCNSSKNAAGWTPNTVKDCLINNQCATMCGSTCADITSNSSHCGQCFNQCPAGLSCGASKCTKCVAGTKSFSYTGAVQSFALPAGCSTLKITAKGAGGASGGTMTGGAGGLVEGKATLTSGASYIMVVGGKGNKATYNRSAPGGGGFSGLLEQGGAHVISAGGGGGSTRRSAIP